MGISFRATITFLGIISLSAMTACGSSDSSGAGGQTTTGTGGATLSCREQCMDKNPAAAQVFEGYQLSSCGCAAGSICASDCTAECAAPSTLDRDSACGMCLLTEGNKGSGSACTITAGAQCLGSSTCNPFVSCALKCP